MSERRRPIEFDCEGCGIHVFSFGADRRPSHGLCATCAWLCTYATAPETFDHLFRHMKATRQ